MIRVIAIDDEPLALRQLEMYISRLPFLTLVASCNSAAAARPFLDGADAMFLDINMPDISGMDFIKSLRNPPAVVFTTAYSNYAVEGFRVNAVDYLLKPFSFEEFRQSCEKLRRHFEMEQALKGHDSAPLLHFKADYHTIGIDPDKIVYIEGMNEYIKIYTSDSPSPAVVHYSLKNLILQLPEGRFMRIHRSYIISLSHIKEASHSTVKLDNGATFPVGEVYRPEFIKYLDNEF